MGESGTESEQAPTRRAATEASECDLAISDSGGGNIESEQKPKRQAAAEASGSGLAKSESDSGGGNVGGGKVVGDLGGGYTVGKTPTRPPAANSSFDEMIAYVKEAKAAGVCPHCNCMLASCDCNSQATSNRNRRRRR